MKEKKDESDIELPENNYFDDAQMYNQNEDFKESDNLPSQHPPAVTAVLSLSQGIAFAPMGFKSNSKSLRGFGRATLALPNR